MRAVFPEGRRADGLGDKPWRRVPKIGAASKALFYRHRPLSEYANKQPKCYVIPCVVCFTTHRLWNSDFESVHHLIFNGIRPLKCHAFWDGGCCF